MAHLGAANLSEIELITLILGSGTKHKPVIQLAKDVVRVSGKNLDTVTLQELQTQTGLGHSQACRVIAGIELGRRLSVHPPLPTITTPDDVVHATTLIRSKQKEYVVGLYLNARTELLSQQTLTIGSLNANVLEPRDVLAPALTLPASAIILVHNHPSGDPSPSQDDLRTTQRLKEAAELLGIALVDHVIVTPTHHLSMRAEKLMGFE